MSSAERSASDQQYDARARFARKAALQVQLTHPPDWTVLFHRATADHLCHLPGERPLRPDITTLRPQTVEPSTVRALVQGGGTLVELFGGMCAGLEGCLRQGISVPRYYYCASSPACRKVAQARIYKLHQEFPHLF